MMTETVTGVSPRADGKKKVAAYVAVGLIVCGLFAGCGLFLLTAWYAGCATFWAGPWVLNSPRPECAHLIQAAGFMQAGDYQNAVNHIAFELEKNPNNPDAYALRGDLNQGQGLMEDALADYTRAIEINPEDATSWSCRAYILARQNRDLDQALADVERALELAPGRADYLDTRALVQYRRGEYQAAIRDAQQAIEKGELFGHYTLGLTYQAQHETALAIEQFYIFIRTVDPGLESGQGQDSRDRIVAMGGTVP